MNMKKYVVATIGLLGFAVSAAPIIKSGEKIAFMGDSITQFGAGHEGDMLISSSMDFPLSE